MSAQFTANYDTQDELNYIQKIGTFRVVGRQKYTKFQLLSFYKQGISGRRNWGNIDKEAVLEYLEKEIEDNK